MTTTLPAQWAQTHARIGIERENAIKAHLEVRAVLEKDGKLREWGVDTVLIGSYTRKTAIYPCKDVDVFVKLPDAPDAATPEQVFTEVQRALVAHFGARATEQRRSMKISGFEDDLTCDVVPAIPDGERWKIPQTDTKPVGERWIKDRWELTTPERLTELTIKAHQASSVISGQPSYLRTVRLIKQMRDTHIGRAEKPGGLYFELLTYWAFLDGAAAASYAELLVPVLDSITTRLASGVAVTEPAMDQPYAPAPDPAVLTNAASVFGGLAADARRALTLEECGAAVVWRQMLGRNDKVGWAFPLPPGCTETGARIEPLANRDRGSNADRGFA
jgi:hypothetical protein